MFIIQLIDSLRYLSSGENTPRKTKFHLKLAADWLMLAQVKGRGGFAHSYSLMKGWMPPYSETTGYLIPTLLQLSRHLQESLYLQSVLTAGKWLVEVQNSDGSYDSLAKSPMVFNTGQIIQGLLAAYRHTHERSFLDAAMKAAEWIVGEQESDGSWIHHSYRGIPHTYYVKVAAALFDLGIETKEDKFRDAADKNLKWTLAQQLDNGFFGHNSFEKEKHPLLHTIVYVAEGLLDLYAHTSNPTLLASLKKWGDAMLAVDARDFPLSSRYRDDWGSALEQQCVPGICQWTHVAFRLYHLFDNPQYKTSGIKNAHYLKSRQIVSTSPAINGALPASIPIWGEYVPYSFVNWGLKYFIDGLLALDQLEIPFSEEKAIYLNQTVKRNKIAVH